MSNSIERRLKELTKPQVQLLKELRENRYLAILSEPCAQFGDWSGKDNFSINIFPNSIFQLKFLSLIYFEQINDINLRWDRCRVSKLGKEFLDENT